MRFVPANALSLPVRTIAPMSWSSSYFFRASLSSTKRGLDKAFNAFGLFRVTVLWSASQVTVLCVRTQSNTWARGGDKDILIVRGGRLCPHESGESSRSE
jgi:hypothetical protein